MKAFRALLFFLAAIRPLVSAERDVVRTFAFEPGDSLAVDTYRGAITVTGADVADVRIAVHLEIGGKSDAEAERNFATLQLDIARHDHVISVLARHPSETRARFVWQEEQQIAPTFRITVPHRSNLRLKTLAGTIVIGEVSGQLSAEAETGDVFFRHVGGTAAARTTTGDVVISQCDGAVDTRVLNGTIRVGVVSGSCVLVNRNGDVEAQELKGPCTVRTEAGTAVIGIPRDFMGPGEITSSGGSVRLRVDPATHCRFELTAGFFGHVENHLPGATPSAGRRLDLDWNGGGPQLKVTAKGGNIRVDPGETPFQ